MIWKQSRFWLVTLVFLVVNLLIVYLAYPPLLKRLRSVQQQSTEIRSKLVDDRQFVQNLDALNLKSNEIKRYFQLAEMALPKEVASDILLLQLDGLLQATNLGALSITVPFSQGISTTLLPPTETPESEVKAGSIGASRSNQPAKTAAVANSSFTLSGDIGFNQMKILLAQLATLARWHRLSSVELTVSAEKTTGSLTAAIFTLPEAPSALDDLDAGFLEAAKKVFDPLRPYATAPDSQTEGAYGRPDPLAPL